MLENSTRLLKVTEGNLRNSHIYIAGNYDFFPSDCIGPSNRKRVSEQTVKPIQIRFEGLNGTIETDIATDSRTGKPRRELRNRQWIGRFFRYHQIQAGDTLALTRTSERSYSLYPHNTAYQRRVMPASDGDTDSQPNCKAIELFVGAGGLALGAHNAGFEHVAVLDWDANACKTLRENKKAGVESVHDWQIVEGDVQAYDFSVHRDEVDFVFGGPPCQPFSLGGKHLGQDDSRNMFPQAVRAVREIQPKAFIFENVKGLLRKGFANEVGYRKLKVRRVET